LDVNNVRFTILLDCVSTCLLRINNSLDGILDEADCFAGTEVTITSVSHMVVLIGHYSTRICKLEFGQHYAYRPPQPNLFLQCDRCNISESRSEERRVGKEYR